MNALQTSCPGCGRVRFSGRFRLLHQPVVLNYRFVSKRAAQKVQKGDINLRQCSNCGLIFNSTFEVNAVPYDERYENRQCFSATFQAHLENLADDLIARNNLRGKRILEIGCGKGDFLRLLCRRASATGIGYDTTFEGTAGRSQNGVRFYKSYLTPDQVPGRFDAVICRHVIEHVPDVAGFLRELRKILAACGDPVIVIETPRFEWIAENLSLCDVCYEHCNYLTMASLSFLCERAGFDIVEHKRVFGEQYQVLKLRIASGPRERAVRASKLTVKYNLSYFATRAQERFKRLKKQLRNSDVQGNWAIWGAGAKGVGLVNLLGAERPRFVIDQNTSKQGCMIPGSDVTVISPMDPRLLELDFILIANPNYEAEITALLRQLGFAAGRETNRSAPTSFALT